jgi:hypothetical protein
MLHFPDACCTGHALLRSAQTRRQSVVCNPLTERVRTGDQRDELAWAAALARARTQWPDSKLDNLIERTVTDIRRTVGTKRAAFAWTGAQDSLILAYVAGLAGVHQCVLAITDLEYPQFLRWVTDHMPDGLTVVPTGHDLPWLRQYPYMLFPHGTYARHWHTLVQQRSQQRYYHEHRLGMLLQAPRRLIDNKYSYGPSKELTWHDRSGVLRYTPLVDWSPQAMLALIQREQIPLPPCYGWPRGLQVGPGPWPARQETHSTYHGFDEVWAIDPDIIRSAAPQLPLAARWLDITGRS